MNYDVISYGVMDEQNAAKLQLIGINTVTLLAAAGMHMVLNQRPRKSKTEWMKRYLRHRVTKGAVNTIIRELSNYPNEYRNYLRMNKEAFKVMPQ